MLELYNYNNLVIVAIQKMLAGEKDNTSDHTEEEEDKNWKVCSHVGCTLVTEVNI